jgi:hypothetical protein
MADMNGGVSEAILAANKALLTVDVLVAKQLVQAEAAYTLTKEMIQQKQGALAIPLIVLSVAAIRRGLTAYAMEQISAESYSMSMAAQTQRALKNSQSVYQAAVSRLQQNQ